ncbi:hypothetical protein D3C77_574930 [compost metagenome]
MHFLAGAAAAAGDVEGHRHQVADFQVLDVLAQLDHFTGDFVTQDQADLGGGTTADHVLVGAADVGGDNLENYTMFDFTTARILQLWIINVANFHLSGTNVNDTSVNRTH